MTVYAPDLVEAHKKAHELLVCRCRHTGEFRVITRQPGDHCEKCNPDNCQPMSRASVQGAFNFLTEDARAALAREAWVMSFKATDPQRDWLRANREYELVDPVVGAFFEKVGTLYMHGVYEEGNAFASGRFPGSLAVGIKRKV